MKTKMIKTLPGLPGKHRSNVPTGKHFSNSQKASKIIVLPALLRESGLFCGGDICLFIPQGSGAGQTKADVVVPVVRVVVVPIGRTRVLAVVVPRPAAYHPVIAGNRSPFIVVSE